MKKIKLKDYKGNYICYLDEYNNVELVDVDDEEKIKELCIEKENIWGTILADVFDEYFIDQMQNFFEDWAWEYGYDDINDRIDYNSDEFKKIKEAVREFIKSLGDINKSYYRDINTMIEVE